MSLNRTGPNIAYRSSYNRKSEVFCQGDIGFQIIDFTALSVQILDNVPTSAACSNSSLYPCEINYLKTYASRGSNSNLNEITNLATDPHRLTQTNSSRSDCIICSADQVEQIVCVRLCGSVVGTLSQNENSWWRGPAQLIRYLLTRWHASCILPFLSFSPRCRYKQ